MKTRTFVTISLLLLFLCNSCNKKYMAEFESLLSGDNWKDKCEAEGTVITVQFTSPSLEGNLLGDPAERNVNVYLPADYFNHQMKRFPVIYFLHGLPAGENALMDPVPYEIFRQVAQLQAGVDFPENGFTEWVNELIESGDMKEAIIVMPDGRNFYGLSAYTNSVVQGNYEDYIVKDLVGFIDRNFRTIAHFNQRAITGHCLGAYGALKLAMKHPEVFRYTAGLSPGHFPDETVAFMAAYILIEDEITGFPGPTPYDPHQPFKFINNSLYIGATAWLPNPDKPPYFVDIPFYYDEETGDPVLDETLMAKWNSNSLFTLTMQNQQGLKKLKYIYFDCGTNDELMMYPANMALHQMLDDMHIRHQFESYDGTHISHVYRRLGNVLVELSHQMTD